MPLSQSRRHQLVTKKMKTS